MSKIKIGFIGCGGIAQAHLKVLSNIPEVTLKAFCDVDIKRAEECAKKYGGNFYSQVEEMVEKEKLEAVYICIPPFAHENQEIICAENKINLFVEKPVALTIKKAKEIERVIEKNGIITQVGYLLRFNKAMEEVREMLLDKGGPIGLVRLNRPSGIPSTSWWSFQEKSGGPIVEMITHHIDRMRWIVGEIERVYAEYDNIFHRGIKNFTIDDVSTLSLRFKNKAIGIITSSCLSYNPDFYERILAKNMEIDIGWKEIRIYEKNKVTSIQFEGNPMQREDEHFINSVKEGKKTKIPYEEGVKTLEVTLSALKSAKTHQPVNLPL